MVEADASAGHAATAWEDATVQAVLQGDHAAFDTIMEHHAAGIERIVRQFLRDPNDVDDVLQETFVLAYRRLAQFRGESRLRTWLIRIAVNVCKNRRGGSWARLLPFSDGVLPGVVVRDARAEAETNLAEAETDAAIHAALRALPDKYREPIALHFFEDLSGAEIASVLGWRESTVWTRIYAGLKRLRASLETDRR